MEENKQTVVEKTTEETKVNEPKSKQTKGNVTKVKEKMKMKPIVEEKTITKVDLSKPPKTEKEDAVQEPETTTSDATIGESTNEESSEKVVEEVRAGEDESTVQDEEKPVLEEITNEVEEKVEELTEKAEEAIAESIETGKELPKNIQKLMDFMEETGGDLEDYVRLNQDYNKLDDGSLLKEYYKQTKPHLNEEEINFLMEDSFSYDEDSDDDREIRRKKLALKEQVADAKAHLDGQKSKYYEDIKAGSKLTSEQQKAIDFFNRYNKESEVSKITNEKSRSIFNQKTDQFFNNTFKGFDYNVGEKKFRFNVNNITETKQSQSDINNFTKKFLDKNNMLGDAKGYHKSLFTAMNADAIVKHFYEQGKTDALKESTSKSKNIDMDPRQSHGKIEAGGMKFKALGDDSSDFKLKIKNRK